VLDDFTFTANGETYTGCFTARACYVFERATGYPTTELRAQSGVGSDIELAALILGALEGHRVRAKVRRAAWTLDDVLDDILGDLTGPQRHEIRMVVLRAHDKTWEGLPAATGEDPKPQTTG